MSSARRDYRSYLLRLYRVRRRGKSSWRASLHAPGGGEPLHFADLSQLVAFLEQDGDPRESTDEQSQEEETTAGEEGNMDN